MKNSTNLIFKALLASAVLLPMLTSCYDDTAIWNEFDKIENRLDSLENSLNKQFQALNSLIDSKTTISSCDKNSDGSYDVTLSNGVKFTVLPNGTEFSSLVSVMEVNGVKCWATYVDGVLTALTDPSGKPVPVVKEDYRTQVEVAVEDGKYFLVIDGQKYMTGYDVEDMVQVFSSCETHKDATGNIYAMSFTFGEGVKITVAVDGYNGVIFKLANAAGSSSVLTEYYVDYGSTQTILLEKAGVVDYVMQVPDGWRVREMRDQYTEEEYLAITAPAASTVMAGAAVSFGDLKVVSVVEGGKAAVSRIFLSADPFKLFNITGTKAAIEPYTGVQKYVYGITEADEFDEAVLLEKIGKILTSTGDLPKGFAIAENGIQQAHSDIYGSELDSQTAYVFWAIPALYRNGDDAGFYVKEGMFFTYNLAPVSVEISIPEVSLLDADLTVSIEGARNMYAGTSLKTDDLFETIIYQVNNGIIDPVNVIPSYEGAASAFPSADANEDVEFLPASTYVTWVLPCEEDKETYSENDIIYKEFTTKSVVKGGSLKVDFGETAADRTTLSVPVSSENASMIYYVYMSKTDGDRISSLDNDTKADLIFSNKNCKVVKGSSITATIDKVKPATTMWLYAVAVDKDGKYGTVDRVSATTEKLTYNELTLSVTTGEVTSSKATFKIEVSGGTATEFIYWIGRVNENFWTNSSLLGATKNSAQQYMACYPEDENIVKCMSRYGAVAQDGTLLVDDLNMNTNYVFMVLAKDESGLYSKGGYKMVTTLSADLGTIVRTGTDTWNAGKESIKIDWIPEDFEKAENSNMPSAYAFNFSCPSDLTAYVVCSTKEYYDDPEYFLTVEDAMVDIEKFAMRKYDSSIVTFDADGNITQEPDWIDDAGVTHGGFLLNICDFYVHGVPSRGFVTYFAAGSHGEDNCIGWEKGECTHYTRALQMISERCSLDYWKWYFREHRNVKNEEYVERNAKAYLEAYSAYYKDAKPYIFENDGKAIKVIQREATGPDDTGYIIDNVIVMFKDKAGNYYEPMYFPVPNHFTK